MAALPAKFFFWFMAVYIILLMIYILCTLLLAWILGRVLDASVGLLIGWRCLRHVVVKFEKGTIESVLAGEIKLSFWSWYKFCFGFLLEDPKMQVLICNLEVKMRSYATLSCDEVSVSPEFGYDRSSDIFMRSMEIQCGDASLNFNEDSFPKSKSSGQEEVGTSSTTALFAKKPHQGQQFLATVAKYIKHVPEKGSFSIKKLDIRYENRELDLLAENNITGIQFTSVKSKSVENTRECTRLVIHLGLSEIHFLKDAESSVLEFMKVHVESSIVIPIQPDLLIRVGIIIKLEDTQCNLFVSRLEPWLRLHPLKKRIMVLEEETHTLEHSEAAADMTTVLWNGTVSTPEMTVVLYDIDDLPMYHYHFCSKSSRVIANNYFSTGTTVEVTLDKLNLRLGDEYQESFENFGIASNPDLVENQKKKIKENPDLVMHIAELKVNWKRRRMVLTIGVTTMDVYLCFKHVKSLLTNAMSFEALFKRLSVNEAEGDQLPKATGEGIRLAYFHLGSCCVDFCDDTTPRTVSVLSTTSQEFERLKYKVSLEISKFSFCLKKDENFTKMKLERAISIYRDYLEEHTSSSEVTLFDIHKAKLKRQSGGLNELDVCSLFSATDISVRWEPDIHISLYELFLRLKFLVYAQRRRQGEPISSVNDGGPSEEIIQSNSVDEQKTKESVFAIDVETLMISAEVGDGVEFNLKAQSIFCEDPCIGVCLEGLMLGFNGSRFFESTRMVIRRTRTPSFKLSEDDMHICMPYKLQFGAIADSIKDMLRGLRSITVAKEKLIFPRMRETSKPKRSSLKFGRIELDIQKLTAYIEEDPIQGWLDEHYQLMKTEACELAVRLKFLDDNKQKEEIHKRSFQSYYQACKGLVSSEGSGGYREGFRAGFKPSAARTSLLFVCATDFDLSLTAVHGGDACLVEVLKKFDHISEEISGSNIDLKTKSLVIQLRNYTLPLLSGTSSSCKALIVTFPIVQQATCSKPQTSQDVNVGSGPPTKTYSDVTVSFQQGQVSFGVGYEPAFADISYALTMALNRTPPVNEERQSNFHGKIKLSFSETNWDVLATTDPYESLDKLQIVTGRIEFQQEDSCISVHSEDFKIKLSSPVVTSGAAFIEAPVFNFEVKMNWECLSLLAPLKSTSLSLWCSFSFRHEVFHGSSPASLTMNIGAHDLEWLLKFCVLNYDPPHKLRSFSSWPRYKVPRAGKSKNLSEMITELMLRVDASTILVNFVPWDSDDPAKGLSFNVTKLKYELCYARSDSDRDDLDPVYQGLDVHEPKAFINNDKHPDEGFLFSSDHLKIRRQSPKANPKRLLAWQEAGRRNLMTYENRSKSDDDGDSVVIADNCQRVFLYGLKLLWTIENRDAVFYFVDRISRAFEPPKPSPSRQYENRKNLENTQKDSCPKTHQGKVGTSESEEEGTRNFMVNVIEPQFNLHSQKANGRFLLAAVSGRVLARSFHSIMRAGVEVIEQAIGTGSAQVPKRNPEMTWRRMEFSVMLKHVQAHVSPTIVDPGAGLQWLPKVYGNWPRVAHVAGALLERVFMPCDMYFRYTRHTGETPDLKVKPLRELSFNTQHITATITSGQFQVMLDVLANLLFARIPKPGKSSLQCPTEDDDVEEEADEVVPYIEEVQIAKINLEKKERERKLLLYDIRKLSHCSDNMDTMQTEEGEWCMISCRRSKLVELLEMELFLTQKSRKEASASLRMVLQKTAQLRLMEKEKKRSPLDAMCISLQIKNVVWSMLVDGKSFAEVEINDMIFDFDQDCKDIGVARLTMKNFFVRNCLSNVGSDMVLYAWNPPTEWEKKVMLRADVKLGAPKDGNYPLELFEIEIFPLRIHLTATIYKMIWEYFFPEEEPNRLTDLQYVTESSASATIHEERRAGKLQKKKKSRPRKMNFNNIKISQVEMIITYDEGLFMTDVKDRQFLMDTFRCDKFTGTRKKLFCRLKKHMLWGVVKSLFGMQKKKFKGKSQNKRKFTGSDDSQRGETHQHPVTLFNHQRDGAGDGFLISIQGLLDNKGKAKAFDFTKKSRPIFQGGSTSQQGNTFSSIGGTSVYEFGSSSGSNDNSHD